MMITALTNCKTLKCMYKNRFYFKDYRFMSLTKFELRIYDISSFTKVKRKTTNWTKGHGHSAGPQLIRMRHYADF